jgi:hypothetical protein
MTSLAFGNRCGHDPRTPVLDLPAAINKKLPKLLQDTIKKMRGFYANPSNFSFLNHNDRQRRSESREAMVLVLSVLFQHLDLVTMKLVKVNEKGQHENVSIAYLHVQSGLSFSRFKRAWLGLIACGICKSFQQVDSTEEGQYKGLPSIKTITPVLFTALSLNKRLANSREFHSQRRIKRTFKRTPAVKATESLIEHANSLRVKKMMQKSFNSMIGRTRPKTVKSPPPNQNQKLLNRFQQIQDKNS